MTAASSSVKPFLSFSELKDLSNAILREHAELTRDLGDLRIVIRQKDMELERFQTEQERYVLERESLLLTFQQKSTLQEENAKQIEVLMERLADLETSAANFAEFEASFKGMLTSLKMQIDECLLDCNKGKDLFESRTHELTILKQNLHEGQQRIEALTIAEETLQSRLAAAEEAQAMLGEDLRLSRTQCDAAAQLNDKHQEDNRSLTELLRRADNDSQILRKSEAELKAEVEKLRREFLSETARFEEVQKAQSVLVTTLTASVQDLEHRLASSNDKIVSLDADIAAERTQLKEAEQLNARSRGERQGLQMSLDAERTRAAELATSLNALLMEAGRKEHLLKTLQDQIETATAAETRLTEKLELVTSQMNAFQVEVSSLREALGIERGKVSSLEAAMRSDERLDKIIQELEAARTHSESLAVQLANKTSQIAALEAEAKAAEKDKEKYLEKVKEAKQLKSNLSAAEKGLAGKEDLIRNLENSLQEAKAKAKEVEQLRANLATAEKTLADRHEQIRDLEAALRETKEVAQSKSASAAQPKTSEAPSPPADSEKEKKRVRPENPPPVDQEKEKKRGRPEKAKSRPVMETLPKPPQTPTAREKLTEVKDSADAQRDASHKRSAQPTKTPPQSGKRRLMVQKPTDIFDFDAE